MDQLTSDRYFTAVLAGDGMSSDEARLRLFFNWLQGENTGAEWNPLATELPGGEDPANPLWNPQGVRNYATEADGVAATLSTLRQANMAPIWDSIIYETVRPDFAVTMRNTWGTTDFADWVDAGHNPFTEDFGVPWVSAAPTPTPPEPSPAPDFDTQVRGVLDRIAAELHEGTSFEGLLGSMLARMEAAGNALNLNQPVPPAAPPPV